MSRLLRTYGLTEEQYTTLFKEQHGRCWICGKTPRSRRLAVDHCHTTGFVRGLLCPTCNQALAKFRDNAEHLRRAADYLDAADKDFAVLHEDEQDAWLLYRGRSTGKARRARITKAGAPHPRLPITEPPLDDII